MPSTDQRGAEAYVPARGGIDAMRDAAQSCRGCDLYRASTRAVFGEGSRNPELVIVGEQPGDLEDKRGEPFVGQAGRLLDAVLEDAGIDPLAVYRTNAVKHFRFTRAQGKRRIHAKPDVGHIRACRPWLQAELAVLKPTGVLVLGATAGRALLGSTFRVTKVRGQVLDPPAGEPMEWIVATVHPSAVLRSRHRDEGRAALVDDLRVVADRLGER